MNVTVRIFLRGSNLPVEIAATREQATSILQVLRESSQEWVTLSTGKGLMLIVRKAEVIAAFIGDEE